MSTFKTLLLVSWIVTALPCQILADELPIETFFKNREFSDIQLSPDGKYLSAIARIEAAPRARNVVVMEIATKTPNIVTGYKDEDVRTHFWANNERLIFIADRDYDSTTKENQYLGTYSVRKDGKKGSTLHEPYAKDRRSLRGSGSTTGAGGVRETVDILDRLPRDDQHILVTRADTRFLFPDVYRLNIRKGGMSRAAVNEGNAWQWFADHRGQVRAALDAGSDRDDLKYELIYRRDEASPWSTVLESPMGHFTVFGFDEDNLHLWVVSSIGRDRNALFRLNPETGELGQPVFEDPEYDIFNSSVRHVAGLAQSVRGRALFLEYMADKPRKVFFDDAWARRHKALDRVFPETVNTIVDWDDAETIFLVRSWSDRVSGDYYVYDEKKAEATYILSHAQWLDHEQMAEMRPISFEARDGLMLHGYLTALRQAEDGRVPLIVHPHGGPFGIRDAWGFNSEVQFLVNRGYAVLQINYRGSGGYGRRFEQSGYKKWGLEMQDDLTDGVEWAIEAGLADPERVCIYGASYGGYATMVGLVKTPELYRCGINYVGVVDLAALYERTTREYNVAGLSGRLENWWDLTIGNPSEHSQRFHDTSPINAIKRVQAPVLVIHGRLDYTVDIEQYRALVSQLKRHDKPHETLVKRYEGHGFHAEQNNIELYGRIEEFLARHLR